MTGAINVTGFVRFRTNDLELIFDRKLIAFSAMGNWRPVAGQENKLFQYMDVKFFIEQPLNTTDQFTLDFSLPAGGVFSTTQPNTVTLVGNNNQVSILPLPLKVISIEINLHDLAAAGADVAMFLTMFWETKKRQE